MSPTGSRRPGQLVPIRLVPRTGLVMSSRFPRGTKHHASSIRHDIGSFEKFSRSRDVLAIGTTCPIVRECILWMPTRLAYAILRRVATLEAVISLPTRPSPRRPLPARFPARFRARRRTCLASRPGPKDGDDVLGVDVSGDSQALGVEFGMAGPRTLERTSPRRSCPSRWPRGNRARPAMVCGWLVSRGRCCRRRGPGRAWSWWRGA